MNRGKFTKHLRSDEGDGELAAGKGMISEEEWGDVREAGDQTACKELRKEAGPEGGST